jgi:hypothetical protein
LLELLHGRLWLNETTRATPLVTVRQSKRLFIEHFARRLLVAHKKDSTFICTANLSLEEFAESIRGAIGTDGSVIQAAMDHTCMDCTHKKRYREDLIAEGVDLNGVQEGMAEVEPNGQGQAAGNMEEDLPLNMPHRPLQQPMPPEGTPCGYVRMAVMDGKTVGHRVCRPFALASVK